MSHGTISENLTKGLFSKLGAGLREATRENHQYWTAGTTPGAGLLLGGEGRPNKIRATRKDCQMGARTSGGGIDSLLPY